MTGGTQYERREFVKMHGLGNDFVIIDGRNDGFRPSAGLARRIADRRAGIGCDQVIVIAPSNDADMRMLTFNSDGSESEACGNAARCVARMVMDANQSNDISISAGNRILDCKRVGSAQFAVDMGAPDFDWRAIPLSEPANTDAIELSGLDLPPGVAVNVGNPHIVYFVDDVMGVPVDRLGPKIENHPLFPERVNVSFAKVQQSNCIRLKVWERGSGQTRACGTAAVATFAAARRTGRVGDHVSVELDGGVLKLETAENEHIRLIGPAAYVFSGTVDLAALEGADEVA